MRINQITPGMWLATKHPQANNGTAALKNGRMALPVMALAVGRYRVGQQGLCSNVIEQTAWESPSNVVVLVPKVSRWYSSDSMKNITWTSPNCEWETRVINAASMIPWAEFLRRQEERQLVELEVAATRQRLGELHDKVARQMKGITEVCRVSDVYIENGKVILTFKASREATLTPEIKALVDEYDSLAEKLSCRW